MRLIERMRPPSQAVRGGRLERAADVFETWKPTYEDPLSDYASFADSGYRGNGAVFSLISVRAMFLSEAVFRFRSRAANGDWQFFGSPALDILDNPWPQGSIADLISWLEVDGSLAGNAFILRDGDLLQRLRPDRVRVISDGQQVIGYAYWQNGIMQGGEPDLFHVSEIAHYIPKGQRDPLAHFRGMSWMTPIRREIRADGAMSIHKNKFFQHAATPNLVVKIDRTLSPDEREVMTDVLANRFEGTHNAYRTMLVEGGADVEVVGADLAQASFVEVQSAGETRLAAAAGVPPIVVGFAKGLQSATYSNYAQALRRFADLTIRPLWSGMTSTLENIVDVPAGAQLWYEDSEIPALQQDALDDAKITREKALSVGSLILAGFDPESAALAVGLPEIKHTGLTSVQLQADALGTEPTTSEDSDD